MSGSGPRISPRRDGDGWTLAIDFGTSNTAAAVRGSDGHIRELRLGTRGSLMPSAVMLTSSGFVVGESAIRTAATDPSAFEPSPKRRLEEGEILLAGRVVPVVDMVAAVLAVVIERATEQQGRPPELAMLTHPDRWAPLQQEQLLEAAVRAGLDRSTIVLLTEAKAAAWYYSSTTTLPIGSRLAVFDFGAGTCDVAVLQKSSDESYLVEAAEGVDGLGGNDLDARIWDWVIGELRATTPALADELESSGGVRARLMLADRIREAKEALSESSSAPIVVSGRSGEAVLTLTKGEFDDIISGDIARAVELTRHVFAGSDRGPDVLYLAGGSSSIPLVHSALSGLAPIARLGDPKTVVVQGALVAPESESDTDDDDPVPPRPGKAKKILAVVATLSTVVGVVLAGLFLWPGVGRETTEPPPSTPDVPPVISDPPAEEDVTSEPVVLPACGTTEQCSLAAKMPAEIATQFPCAPSANTTPTAPSITCESPGTNPRYVDLDRHPNLAALNAVFDEDYQSSINPAANWPAPTSQSPYNTPDRAYGGRVSSTIRNFDDGSQYLVFESTHESELIAMRVFFDPATSPDDALEWWIANSSLR